MEDDAQRRRCTQLSQEVNRDEDKYHEHMFSSLGNNLYDGLVFSNTQGNTMRTLVFVCDKTFFGNQ